MASLNNASVRGDSQKRKDVATRATNISQASGSGRATTKGNSQRTSHVDPTELQRKEKRKYSTSEGREEDRKRKRTEPKGKDYSTRSEKKVEDRRDPQLVRQRNLECDSKKGGRNAKAGFKMRNCNQIGSDVFNPRPDRIYNADCSGEPLSEFVQEMNNE